MTDPRIEAAVDAVIKARGWRDCRWGDGAIGGFDYSTDNKKRHVIRDHEAEAREGKTVILFETDDYGEYEREYRRACIRREISAALAAADAAAWRPMSEAPRDGTVIEIFQGNRGSWKGIGIATAQYWTAEKLAALEGSADAAGYEGAWYLASNFWGDAEDETNPWLWRPHMPPSVEQQAKGLGDIYTGATPAPYPAPETITIPEVRNDRPIPVKGETRS